MNKQSSPAFLAITDLSFRVPDRTVLSGLNLSLASGEILGLMGPSGCGKTSLLRILAGLVEHAAGPGAQASWSGQIHWAMGRRPFRTGVVFQEDRLLPTRSIDQNLRLACQALPAAVRQAGQQAIPDILASLGLGGPGNQAIGGLLPAALSGGMRHRVSVARALLFGKELQLWDEPFQGIDPSLRLDIAHRVRASFRRECSTALIAGHDVSDMLVLCDRIAIIDTAAGSGGQTATELRQFMPAIDEQDRNFGSDAFRAARQRLENLLHASGLTETIPSQESRLIT